MFSGPHIWRRLIRSCRSRSLTRNGQRRSLRKLRSGDYLPATVATLEARMMLSATVYSSTDVPLSIPDQTTILSTVNVLDSVVIDDVNVTLDITHTTDQDLDVFLIAPGGTRVELFTDVGGGGDHFTGTTLDDEAATAITSGAAPFFGTYRPEGSLSDFDGLDSQGVWTLEVTDDKRRKTGTLNSWSIEISSAAPALPSISIGDVQLAEGDSGTTAFEFPVSRSGNTTGTSSVDFATADGTAAAPADYVAISGTVQFLADETSKTITVQVNGDPEFESDEAFTVVLSNPTGATIAVGQDVGTATITDDDMPVTITISDVTLAEGGPTLEAFVTAGSGGLSHPKNMTIGPDGNLYVAADDVLRYDGSTGAFIDVFVAAGSDGLSNVRTVSFGPDGNLYVLSQGTTSVLRYDGITGAFIDEFVASGSGGLLTTRGMLFSADGASLFVASTDPNNGSEGVKNGILRFDATTGEFLETFVAPGSGGLANVFNMAYGPDGNLYVSSYSGQSNSILRYDGSTGAFIDAFVPEASGGLDGPIGLLFHDDGFLYVSSYRSATVLRYDSITGAYVDTLVDRVRGGLASPVDVITGTNGDLYVSNAGGDDVLRYTHTVTVNLSAASQQTVTVDYTTADGTATGGADYRSASGTLTFAPGETSKKIILSVLDDGDVESAENFTMTLSNPIGGGVITDGIGVVTITDDDSTRSISINDVTTTEADNAPHFMGKFADGDTYGINHFGSVTFGPNGNLYAAGGQGNPHAGMIFRFDGVTGNYIDTFVQNGVTPGVGEMVFRPDGLMYVVSRNQNQVTTFDATTGEFVEFLISGDADGLDQAEGIAFDGVGNIYVSGRASNNVLRYDSNGNFIDEFITAASGLLSTPRGIEFFGGDLYVANSGSNEVQRFDGATGVLIATIGSSATLADPRDVAIGTDGNLYVTSSGANKVVRYNPATGAYIDDYVPTGSGGLSGTHSITFGSDGTLYVTGSGINSVLRYGNTPEAVFTVSLSSASSVPVTVNYSTADVSATSGSDYTATSGTITFDAGVTTRTILVSTSDDTDVEGDETFVVNLTAATGAVIQDSQGVATIQDDDASNDTNALYVYDIRFESKRGGKDWRAVIEIRNDSNANGLADVNDSVRAGVTVTVEFAGQTYTGTTDSNGIFRTSWQRNLSSGNYYANVTDLDLLDYFWSLGLGDENDSDLDGFPDDLLSF
jgi:subtilisin-like proprotein convertase family protein/streptogramin lyase